MCSNGYSSWAKHSNIMKFWLHTMLAAVHSLEGWYRFFCMPVFDVRFRELIVQCSILKECKKIWTIAEITLVLSNYIQLFTYFSSKWKHNTIRPTHTDKAKANICAELKTCEIYGQLKQFHLSFLHNDFWKKQTMNLFCWILQMYIHKIPEFRKLLLQFWLVELSSTMDYGVTVFCKFDFEKPVENWKNYICKVKNFKFCLSRWFFAPRFYTIFGCIPEVRIEMWHLTKKSIIFLAKEVLSLQARNQFGSKLLLLLKYLYFANHVVV